MVQKFDRSIYLVASLVSGLMLSVSAGQVMANPVLVQQNSAIALSGKITAAPSLVGEWKGVANAKGDDVLTHLELSVPAGGGSATWRHIGAKQVNGKWQDVVMKQGDLARTIQGNQVKLTLHGFYGKSLQLQGNFQSGGKKITGYQVGNENFVFRFEK